MLPPALLLAIGVAGKTWAIVTDPGATRAMEWGSNWHTVVARSFLCAADLFAFGMAAAVLVVLLDRAGRADLGRWRAAAAAGAVAIGGAAMLLHARGSIDERVFTTVTALACGLLVLFVAMPRGAHTPDVAVRTLESRPFVFLGVVSYSVYLWHEPVTSWLREHDVLSEGASGVALNLALVFVLTVGLATLTYRFVEAPAMRRRARLTPTRRGERVIAPEPAEGQAAP
jgi:peptidoglycan/LPS O-acetylase OafA/YrhL